MNKSHKDRKKPIEKSFSNYNKATFLSKESVLAQKWLARESGHHIYISNYENNKL